MAEVEPEHGLARHASTVEEIDEAGLAQFHIKEELKREWGMIHNFGISFSIIVGPLLLGFSELRCIADSLRSLSLPA